MPRGAPAARRRAGRLWRCRHEEVPGARAARTTRPLPAPLRAALHACGAQGQAAVPLELRTRSARADDGARSRGAAALFRVHQLRLVRRRLSARRPFGAAGLSRSQPVRAGVFTRDARAAPPASRGRHRRVVRNVSRVPGCLPARGAASGHLRLHAAQARGGRCGSRPRSVFRRWRAAAAHAGRGARYVTGPLRAAGPRGRALERDLCALLGAGAASSSPADLWAMSRDCWPRALLWTKAAVAPHPPDVVAWPASTAEVVQVVRYAAAQKVPIVPFGAGSGVCGGTVPIKGGIALDLKRLSGPPVIDLPARTVDVEVGTNGQRLEELLGAAGATVGHFPSSIYSSTVGGWLAARSAGQLSSRYGKIEDIGLVVEVVDV